MSVSVSWPCCFGIVLVVLVIIMMLQKRSKEKDEQVQRSLAASRRSGSRLRSELEELKKQVENSTIDDDPDSVDITEY